MCARVFRWGAPLLAGLAIVYAGSIVAKSNGRDHDSTLLLSTMTAPASPDYVMAVWKVQSLDFAYHAGNTTYSCTTLQRRLQDILRRVGAQDTLIVVMDHCVDQSDSARVQITLASPVEATEANIDAVTSHDSKDELIAKVRGELLPNRDTLERFPAQWKTISLSRDRDLKLDASDCELVKQLRREVFPRLSIRIVHDNLRCSMAFQSLGQPQLSVAALVATPARH